MGSAYFAWRGVRAAKRSADAAEGSVREAKQLRAIEEERWHVERRPSFNIRFEDVGPGQFYLLCVDLTSEEPVATVEVEIAGNNNAVWFKSGQQGVSRADDGRPRKATHGALSRLL